MKPGRKKAKASADNSVTLIDASDSIRSSSSSSSSASVSGGAHGGSIGSSINDSMLNKYQFRIISALNEAKPSVHAVANSVRNGATSVIESSIKADQELKQFFLEICILAYNLNCVGHENVMALVERVWKVN